MWFIIQCETRMNWIELNKSQSLNDIIFHERKGKKPVWRYAVNGMAWAPSGMWKRRRGKNRLLSMSILWFVLFFFCESSLCATSYYGQIYLIYVIKHLQHFNIQLMLNYWFTDFSPMDSYQTFYLTAFSAATLSGCEIFMLWSYLCTFYEAFLTVFFLLKNPFRVYSRHTF